MVGKWKTLIPSKCTTKPNTSARISGKVFSGTGPRTNEEGESLPPHAHTSWSACKQCVAVSTFKSIIKVIVPHGDFFSLFLSLYSHDDTKRSRH